MALQFGGQRIAAMQYNGYTIAEAMYDGVVVYRADPDLPVVTITGTSGYDSRDQFQQACIDHGTTYQTVEVLPFLLDTSQATNLRYMLRGCAALTHAPDIDTSQVTNLRDMLRDCAALTHVPDMDTSQVTDIRYIFRGCSALTDGNVRLIGKASGSIRTTGMIRDSGLTREPWYDAAGNPI